MSYSNRNTPANTNIFLFNNSNTCKSNFTHLIHSSNSTTYSTYKLLKTSSHKSLLKAATLNIQSIRKK